MFTLGLFLFLGQNLKQFSQQWEGHIQFQLILKDSFSPEDRQSLETALQEEPAVHRWQWISKTEARSRFELNFQGFQEVLAALPENPFPASISIHLNEGVAEDVFSGIRENLLRRDGVETLIYNRELFEKLHFLAQLLQSAGWFFGGVMILASIFTISNVLKLTFFSRKEEVDIMKLVGASYGFIQGPFIFEGLFQGLLGSFTGIAGVLGAGWFLSDFLKSHPEFFFSHLAIAPLSFNWIIILLGTGALSGVLGALFSIHQFLHQHIAYE
jgi:cell division transport system permease protein